MKYTHRLETYRTKTGWRWRIKSLNGKIEASGQGYSRKIDMKRSLDRLALAFVAGTIDTESMK